MDIYKDTVDLRYDEREETTKVGSFQESQETKPQTIVSPKAKKKKRTCSTDEVATPVRMKKDIRSFFCKNIVKKKTPEKE